MRLHDFFLSGDKPLYLFLFCNLLSVGYALHMDGSYCLTHRCTDETCENPAGCTFSGEKCEAPLSINNLTGERLCRLEQGETLYTLRGEATRGIMSRFVTFLIPLYLLIAYRTWRNKRGA